MYLVARGFHCYQNPNSLEGNEDNIYVDHEKYLKYVVARTKFDKKKYGMMFFHQESLQLIFVIFHKTSFSSCMDLQIR